MAAPTPVMVDRVGCFAASPVRESSDVSRLLRLPKRWGAAEQSPRQLPRTKKDPPWKRDHPIAIELISYSQPGPAEFRQAQAGKAGRSLAALNASGPIERESRAYLGKRPGLVVRPYFRFKQIE